MKFLAIFFVALFALAAANPWIQDSELPLPIGPRDPDVETPVIRHPDDCKIYLIGNYPMTCGEGQAFHSEKLACVAEEEADC